MWRTSEGQGVSTEAFLAVSHEHLEFIEVIWGFVSTYFLPRDGTVESPLPGWRSWI